MDRDVIKILYIEDDPFDVTILKETLRSSPELSNDFQIEHAADLFSGVGMLQSEDYDLVLLDMNLPEGTGDKNVKLIAKHAPTVPVVVLTSMNSDRLALEAMAAGAQEFIVKGFSNPFIISRVIRSAIFRKSIENKLLNRFQHDELTGLCSEPHFKYLVSEQLNGAKELQRRDGLLVIKVTNFDDINKDYGRHVCREACSSLGDLLNLQFENEITGAINEGEYALYHMDCRKDDIDSKLMALAQKVIDVCSGPYSVHHHNIDMQIKIGIASHPENGECYDSLFYAACNALSKLDKSGKKDQINIATKDDFETGRDKLIAIS